ncbi:MAG: methyltransferase domain-containing protein [Candidatus Dormibacteria bacterium]
MLEIGCGSRQLTYQLLARGLRVTAVEPGANLIALAAERCCGAGEVDFVPARFEGASLPAAPVAAVSPKHGHGWAATTWRGPTSASCSPR